MDVAYDHIQEEVLVPEEGIAPKTKSGTSKANGTSESHDATLNTELRDAYKSFSASPWGAKLGGFFNDVAKSSSTFYEEARSEAGVMSEEAVKGLTGLRESLVMRARSLSSSSDPAQGETSNASRAAPTSNPSRSSGEQGAPSSQTQSLETDGMISRFKSEASKRLKELEKAEEAADAAILRFGANIGSFLKEAVSVAPPSSETNPDGTSKILFESRDQEGKRVIHGTRFEAQLHAIHTRHDKFTLDPDSEEYRGKWKPNFKLEDHNTTIAKDLTQYDELARTKEKLVPARATEVEFWCRYYFLRMVVETDEARRREMLKGAAASHDDQVSWDDDSDSEASTPHQAQPHSLSNSAKATTANSNTPAKMDDSQTSSSVATAASTEQGSPSPTLTLKGNDDNRRSQDEKSQPDSDASYDVLSGATSIGPASPRDSKQSTFVNAPKPSAAARNGPAVSSSENDTKEEDDWE